MNLSCPVVWWDRDKLIWFRWCQACVAATRWGVQRQVCLAYSQVWWWSLMVWSCMSAAGTGELQFIEGTMNANMYCDIPKQSMIPSLWRLGRREVFQHNDPKHTLQDDQCLANEAEGKGNMWGNPQTEGVRAQVSNIHQLRDVITVERKRTPVATCEALVNSMPKRVKALLENNGGHTNIESLGPIWTFHLGCTHFCDQRFRH